MDRLNKVKEEICSQIMKLDVAQLETLTDAIDHGDIEGVVNPPEVLTCSMCEKLYGECRNRAGECERRYGLHMAG